ncbi:MAG: nucleoid-associated protein [Bacteroidia bacterium]|nr:nucleoid-associated protein [Bacteroidia bacterium]
MLNLSQARLTTLALHKVGNKAKNEGVVASQELFILEEDMALTLKDYFLNPFKTDEFFKFTHPTDLNFNELYIYCNRIFTLSREDFLAQSVHILNHLYAQSGHPHIKSGELYVGLFRECVVDGVELEAIGIFKSEHKDQFLKFVAEEGEGLTMTVEQGVNLRKLDKGCLIFNTFADDGYSVLMIDKGSEDAQYWRDDFLQVIRIQDNRYQTEQFLNLTKEYCENVIGKEKDKKDQVVFLNKSLNYFSKNKELDIEDFKLSVFPTTAESQKFDEYRATFEQEQGLPPAEEGFPISKYGVRVMKKQFASLIRLDTEIEIRMNNRKIEEVAEFMERGYDEQRRMHYYKVFFNEELE